MAKKTDNNIQNQDNSDTSQNSQTVNQDNQSQEFKQKWLRAVADYQNLEKRVEKEKSDWIRFANTNLLTQILEVNDNLERAANFIKDPGLNMVRDSLNKVLKDHDVEEVKVLGEKFDPSIMECIDQKEGEENTVLEVTQKGYRLNGKLIRPAKVVVGKSAK
jgi:molecular chaperone GrpE